jgi:hypothetical protein
MYDYKGKYLPQGVKYQEPPDPRFNAEACLWKIKWHTLYAETPTGGVVKHDDYELIAVHAMIEFLLRALDAGMDPKDVLASAEWIVGVAPIDSDLSSQLVDMTGERHPPYCFDCDGVGCIECENSLWDLDYHAPWWFQEWAEHVHARPHNQNPRTRVVV